MKLIKTATVIAFGAIMVWAGPPSHHHSGLNHKTTAQKNDSVIVSQSTHDSMGMSDTAKAMKDTTNLKFQTTCPVMGGQVNRDLYVDYKGNRIYVCCKMCLSKVKKDPEKFIKKLESMKEPIEKAK